MRIGQKSFLIILVSIASVLCIVRTLILFYSLSQTYTVYGVGWNRDYPPSNVSDISYVWDGGFYVSIAKNGYSYMAPDLAFPPLYPAVIRLLLPFMGAEIAALFVNFVCLGIFIPLLSYRLSSILFDDEGRRRMCSAIVTFNPYICAWGTIALSEPLAYLLSILTLIFFFERRYLLSSVVFPLGILSRYPLITMGILFLYPIVTRREKVGLLPLITGTVTYLGWDYYLKIAYGLSNSQAREIYWHHHPEIILGGVISVAQLSNFALVLILLIFSFSHYLRREDKVASAMLWASSMWFLISIFPPYGYAQLRYYGAVLPVFLFLEAFDGLRERAIMYLLAAWGLIIGVLAPQIYQIYLRSLDPYPYLFTADVSLALIVLSFLLGAKRNHKLVIPLLCLAGTFMCFLVPRMF